MNITLRQLRTLHAVANHLSYTKAAAELHLTQPAVSMQIQQLEDNLGVALFEQLGRQIFLTDAGREIAQYANAIKQQLVDIQEFCTSLQGIEAGTLKVAAPGTANQFVTLFLAEFCRRYPGVTFQLNVANRQELLAQLTNNETDLVIMGKPPEGEELISECFMGNPLVVIAAPDHPLATRKRISLTKLMQNEFVVRESGSGTRIAMERFFTEHAVELCASMEVASNESIKNAVAAGLGLGIVSLHTLALDLALNRIVTLTVQWFPIMRHWYIVYREGKRLSPVAQAFRQFVLTDAKAVWPLP